MSLVSYSTVDIIIYEMRIEVKQSLLVLFIPSWLNLLLL